jgi:acetyltransferase-like isoleucine patch superfamily enzyme
MGILGTKSEVGKDILVYKVVGTHDEILKYEIISSFIVTVGQFKDVSLRIRLQEQNIGLGGGLAILIASTAYVSKYSIVGAGRVVKHNVFVNAGAVIGKGCIINAFSNIEHDVTFGDYCHIATGVMIKGYCSIKMGVAIGS